LAAEDNTAVGRAETHRADLRPGHLVQIGEMRPRRRTRTIWYGRRPGLVAIRIRPGVSGGDAHPHVEVKTR
jgi:hypothetical protein